MNPKQQSFQTTLLVIDGMRSLPDDSARLLFLYYVISRVTALAQELDQKLQRGAA